MSKLKEISPRVLDTSWIEKMNPRRIYARVILENGERFGIHKYSSFGVIDVEKETGVKIGNNPYTIDVLKAWDRRWRGLVNIGGIQFGRDRSPDDQFLDGLERKIVYHQEKEKEHDGMAEKAKSDRRSNAYKEHTEAAKAHNQALYGYKEALSLKDDSKLGELESLAEYAREQSLEALDADNKFQKVFPNRNWFKQGGYYTILATKWAGLNRRPTELTKVGGIFQFKFYMCEKIKKLEYRTPRSGGWQPIQLFMHLAGRVGRSWTGQFEFRANRDDNTISTFEIPSFPVEKSEDAELDKAIKLLSEGRDIQAKKILLSIRDIREDKKSQIEDMKVKVEKQNMILSSQQLWDGHVLRHIPDHFREARTDKMKVEGLDTDFKITTLENTKQIVALSEISSIPYIPNFWDCDKAVMAMRVYFAQHFGINPILMVFDKHKKYGSNHAWVIAVVIGKNSKIELIGLETLTGKFFSLKERDLKKYPWKGSNFWL